MSEPFIDPEQFVERLDAGQLADDLIVDVRERHEWDYYRLPEATLMPMNTIPERLPELPGAGTIYVVCAHGVRSAMVCDYLRQRGIVNVCNVEGGMAAIAALRGFAYD